MHENIRWAAYQVRPGFALSVVCHRQRHQKIQFLVRWTSETPRCPHSWHGLTELGLCLVLVQEYTESLQQSPQPPPPPPHLQPSSPQPRHAASPRDRSIIPDIDVYDGDLQRRQGWLVVKSANVNPSMIDLPSPSMLRAAASITISNDVYTAMRLEFMGSLLSNPELWLDHSIDETTPSLRFKFLNTIDQHKDAITAIKLFSANTHEAEGCDCAHAPGKSCSNTKSCECLEYAVDEQKAEQRKSALYQAYKNAEESGDIPNTKGLPKLFPYHPARNRTPACMKQQYLQSRYVVYECSLKCNCNMGCKHRLVQHGRKVPLTIFKTKLKGWAVYCNKKLIKGEFVETYLGELITSEEANRREDALAPGEHSYRYCLDKFVGKPLALSLERCLLIDATDKGNVARFINHSCDPNLRVFCISYNKHNKLVYDLALFAVDDIPACTELTVDYLDRDYETMEDVVSKREAALGDPANAEQPRCLCGSKWCRGLLWI